MLFIILIAGIALSSTEEAYAVNADKNLPMGNAEDIRIEGDVVHFCCAKAGKSAVHVVRFSNKRSQR